MEILLSLNVYRIDDFRILKGLVSTFIKLVVSLFLFFNINGKIWEKMNCLVIGPLFTPQMSFLS